MMGVMTRHIFNSVDRFDGVINLIELMKVSGTWFVVFSVFLLMAMMALRKMFSSLQITISVQDVIFKMINYSGDDVDSSLMLSRSPWLH